MIYLLSFSNLLASFQLKNGAAIFRGKQSFCDALVDEILLNRFRPRFGQQQVSCSVSSVVGMTLHF
jgi:hypothetical protein